MKDSSPDNSKTEMELTGLDEVREASDSEYEEDDDNEEFHQDGNEAERDEVEEIRKLARHETRNTKIWRAIVLILMVLLAALVTWGTYDGVRAEKVQEFETGVSSSVEMSMVIDDFDGA